MTSRSDLERWREVLRTPNHCTDTLLQALAEAVEKVEQLTEKAAIRDTCVVCACDLFAPSGPPHCWDCFIDAEDEEQQERIAAYQKAVEA